MTYPFFPTLPSGLDYLFWPGGEPARKRNLLESSSPTGFGATGNTGFGATNTTGTGGGIFGNAGQSSGFGNSGGTSIHSTSGGILLRRMVQDSILPMKNTSTPTLLHGNSTSSGCRYIMNVARRDSDYHSRTLLTEL